METAEVLARCHAERVRLYLTPAGELRAKGAGPELLTLLKANRAELRTIVGSGSWPWLGQTGFVLAQALCGCCVQIEMDGQPEYLPVHAFSRDGEALCLGCVAKRIGGQELTEL